MQVEPLLAYAKIEAVNGAKNAGLELLKEGKMGCLLVAGGQGTRLRFEGPKGLFPISLIKHKTLFQLFAERTAAASKLAGKPLPLSIMISPQNEVETRAYFKRHNFFGLDASQVYFFTQGMLPLMTPAGDLCLESTHALARGPDGNGTALYHFVKSGIWDDWKAQGVSYVNFVQIDNCLADPFDVQLLGAHALSHAEVTIKCVERKAPLENVGVVVQRHGKAEVIEYTELPSQERLACANGRLKHPCANISLFCFNMDFIGKAAFEQFPMMPLHMALKSARYIHAPALTHDAAQKMAWKGERFIFDVLCAAQRIATVMYPREMCFAPLKNFSGEDSITTVQKALQAYDSYTFAQIGQLSSGDAPFELSPEFYYPTPGLLAAWKGKSLPQDAYVEA